MSPHYACIFGGTGGGDVANATTEFKFSVMVEVPHAMSLELGWQEMQKVLDMHTKSLADDA